jgi:hypothetical protein
MGTNYYWHEREPCQTCGRRDEPLHIGKSSVGWVFALHIMPDDGINDLPDWEARWDRGRIEDEYGRALSPDEMRNIITGRQGAHAQAMTPAWLRENSAEHGPNGLARARIDHHCVGHGSGTWDLHRGDFS